MSQPIPDSVEALAAEIARRDAAYAVQSPETKELIRILAEARRGQA